MAPGGRVQAAVMVSFSPPQHVEALSLRLAAIAPPLGEIEVEELVLYGDVGERLKQLGIGYRSSHGPRRVSPGQV